MENTTIGIYNQISLRIIHEQEAIIGPLAWSEASKVDGLTVDATAGTAVVSGQPKEVIDTLVSRYEKLFGRLSRDVCREAVGDLTAEIATGDLPQSLQ